MLLPHLYHALFMDMLHNLGNLKDLMVLLIVGSIPFWLGQWGLGASSVPDPESHTQYLPPRLPHYFVDKKNGLDQIVWSLRTLKTHNAFFP